MSSTIALKLLDTPVFGYLWQVVGEKISMAIWEDSTLILVVLLLVLHPDVIAELSLSNCRWIGIQLGPRLSDLLSLANVGGDEALSHDLDFLRCELSSILKVLALWLLTIPIYHS